MYLQDTGNPVLDSFVNIVSSGHFPAGLNNIEALHGMLVKLAEKEPGGLKVHRSLSPVTNPRETRE